MNQGPHSTLPNEQTGVMNLMGEPNALHASGAYSAMPTYINNDSYDSRGSPAQASDLYAYNGRPPIKTEPYGNPESPHPLKNDAYNLEQPQMKYDTNGGSSLPARTYSSGEGVKTESYSPHERSVIKSENYGTCEQSVVKNETYGSCERPMIKSELYSSTWSGGGATAHQQGDGYPSYGSPHEYVPANNQEYALSMPQDYLGSPNHMVGGSTEQQYHQMAKIKQEMDMSAQLQPSMSLHNSMYSPMSSLHSKMFQADMPGQSEGYQPSSMSLHNPMYNLGQMSSQNHFYDQPSTSSHPKLYQQAMATPGHEPGYQPAMSPHGHLMYHQSSMSQHATSHPYHQQYPMYNNSNTYQVPNSSIYPPYLPQNPWTNFNPGFPTTSDDYSDSVNCSPKKKSKMSISASNSKKEPVQIVSQQHFHSKRGIYTFEVNEMSLASNNTFSITDNYLMIEKRLCESLIQIDLPDNVCYVYNPLEYAFNPHRDFIEKYCNTQKQILFLGMNPGPFGMSQNGVPFGEYNIVRDWLKITGDVSKPVKEHPKRLIAGLDCKRSEVTGSRFWGYFRKLCGTPENFFKHCFVYNMCPMAFMSDTGKNITPPQIPANVLKSINTVCNTSLLEVIQLLNVKTVIGVGNYAYNAAQKLMASANMDHIKVHVIMHPSPINPAANKGWDNIARDQLRSIGILELLQSTNPGGQYDYNTKL
ncbi:hypothetical protein SNE40_010050 [Patella caerulea]|uniref:Uracil-DNA glycosylase-like domain-containing protein n=1 Tax=Patella caerulea TaxID=87958 RepID=A0AAN8JQU5_PATCE